MTPRIFRVPSSLQSSEPSKPSVLNSGKFLSRATDEGQSQINGLLP
ncbi:hypothetical protein PMI11_05999 [Rhizobium sp. CF142]|nr:hypothetical protein PMI11_05999 [Rhizobium sp. CF142]